MRADRFEDEIDWHVVDLLVEGDRTFEPTTEERKAATVILLRRGMRTTEIARRVGTAQRQVRRWELARRR